MRETLKDSQCILCSNWIKNLYMCVPNEDLYILRVYVFYGNYYSDKIFSYMFIKSYISIHTVFTYLFFAFCKCWWRWRFVQSVRWSVFLEPLPRGIHVRLPPGKVPARPMDGPREFDSGVLWCVLGCGNNI